VAGSEGGAVVGGSAVEVKRKQRCKNYDSKCVVEDWSQILVVRGEGREAVAGTFSSPFVFQREVSVFSVRSVSTIMAWILW
jgi:hypothetical protein